MAFTTVVTSRFFETMVEALKKLQADPRVGELSLAMLVPSPVDSERYSFVVAGKNLDALGLWESTGLVSDLLDEILGEQRRTIDGVSVLRTEQSFVKKVAKRYSIPEVGLAHLAINFPSREDDAYDPVLFVSRAA